MEKKRQTIINQIFDNWKNKKWLDIDLLDKNGRIEIPIHHLIMRYLLLVLFFNIVSNFVAGLYVIGVIELLLQIIGINYSYERIYFKKDGIVRKHLFNKQEFSYDEITSISATTRIVIQCGSKKIILRQNTAQLLDKYSINRNVKFCQVRFFCQKVFPEKYTCSALNHIQQGCEAIFAAIVQTTHDEKSRKYAIEYLKRFVCADRSEDYIANRIDKLCQGKISKLIDKCIIVANNMLYSEKKEFLDHLFECAYISDGVDEKELAVLQFVAKYFKIKEWDFKAMLYKYEYNKAEQEEKEERKQEKQRKRQEEQKRQEHQKKAETCLKDITTTAHNTLGVKADASITEIKSAYRKLAKKMHPDALPADATSEQIEEANENFRVINEAYEFLVDLHAEKVSLKN